MKMLYKKNTSNKKKMIIKKNIKPKAHALLLGSLVGAWGSEA